MRLRSPFGLLSLGALLLALAFLVLPIVAIFADVSPARLIDALGTESAREALWLSLRTSAIAIAIVVIVGTPAAYLLGRRRFRGRALVITAIELPLVVPPAVAGIGLLAALGPRGILGGAVEGAGIELVFETAGVVVALIFVSAPFYLRQAIATFGALDSRPLEAARTLGAGPFRAFATVAVPSARPGLASGLALAWGRALGEFGATLLFAGSLPGATQTAPLAIFAEFSRPDGFVAALALSAVLIVVAAALLLSVKLLGGEGLDAGAGGFGGRRAGREARGAP
jgi:molybdate transport system permease protein